MTRKMYDSTTSADCPADGDLYAGYVDGTYKWSDADWALHAGKVLVRIAVFAATNDGHVLDVEQGASTPQQAPGWAKMRRAAGVDPSVYVNLSNWQATRDAFTAAGEPEPHYWLAHYDNAPFIPVGAVAKQYADAAMTGGHYDASVVEDHWPGVDKAFPQYVGQGSIEIDLAVGQVAVTEAVYDYGKGNRMFPVKLVGREPGLTVYYFYPPADPDADQTIEVSARPAVFVVVVRPKP